ncbi:putative ribosome biogenesis protein nep1 [Cardiosporidium cionae]|uniref:Ribosome biogenesis protein nep1 n=1 Tax=Cardiosporidium cionae TaxID=476202 RepID=A0ABQ7J8J3_9APIC|nr:putative ribosome biogenesis protein nep1 [Cardiosporidium cionae]|eukprot:KAF8820310.1 putative ribosome biogenesis protein nep1 [Cardiosporidium cionae]
MDSDTIKKDMDSPAEDLSPCTSWKERADEKVEIPSPTHSLPNFSGLEHITEEAHYPRVIVVLEAACLELTEGRNKSLQLLNNLDHRNVLKKLNRPLNDARPDITHQCLMALLDSPLNKAGKLLLYIRTARHQLIQVSPQLMVPRTWKQFNAMMVTFLQKFKIKAVEKNVALLQLIKNDILETLPVGSRKIGLSVSGKKVKLNEYVSQRKADTVTPTFFIGAVAHSDPGTYLDHLIDYCYACALIQH